MHDASLRIFHLRSSMVSAIAVAIETELDLELILVGWVTCRGLTFR